MERDIDISSQRYNINQIRYFLEKFFIDSDLNMNHFNRVFLGVSEAVNNSIVHGNKMDENKYVFIHVRSIARILLVEVKDQGDGFFLDSIDNPICSENLSKENGRGIFILRSVADNVQYFDGGRSVLISFKLD